MLFSRAIGSLAFVLASSGVTFADEPAPPAANELTAKEIDARIAPASGNIRRCYLDAVGDAPKFAGAIAIELVVHRDGSVHSIAVAVSGPSAKAARMKIDDCVRAILEPLAFPARRRFTTARVPFVFQKTTAPNSGPQHSCWNKDGCRTPKSKPGSAGVPLAKR